MQTRILVALLWGCATTAGALAETIVVDDQVQVRQSPARHPTVGKPPITRWDYPSFSVFFEHDRVIHAVAPANTAPAPIPAG